MAQDAIIDFLDELFDGLKVDSSEESAAVRFTIEVDNGVNMILDVSNDCLAAQSVGAIEQAIADSAKPLLEANHNAVVTMATDLSCSA
jgi:hypothetical protein